MAFHRFAVPSYTGGLPSGYDYINNATSGTPAPADGALGAGLNAGSYFFGAGEQATAAAWNRAAKALAENTDTLDDLLHRDLAVPEIQDFSAAGSPVSQIVLTGPGVFIGKPGTPNTVDGIGTFVQITDQNDNEIVNSGVACKVTAISDTVGSGFSAGNVTLTVSPAIPAGIAYRVYFAMHGNLASLPVDAFTSIHLGSKGGIQLAGDLAGSGGTAAAPRVSGLTGIAGVVTNAATRITGSGNPRMKPHSDVANVQTTDDTETSLFEWTIPDEAVSLVTAEILAVTSDGSATAAYVVRARIKRDGGTVTVGTPEVTLEDEDSLDGTVTIDNSNSTGRIRVTGIAATTIDWGAIVTRLELTHA